MPQKLSNKKMSDYHRLTNYMEELAQDMLDGLMDEPEYKYERFSDASKQDVKALALNRLWPMYTTTGSGKDYLRKIVVEDKIEQDIIRELKAAIAIVRSNPRN